MGRTSKNSEESSGNNIRRKSRSKTKKDEIPQSSITKPAKQQKHQKDRIRSLPISIQKNLVRVRECESQGPSPTPESDIFYQQNSGPSGLKFKNPNFQFSALKGNKKRLWKNLKQILTAEKALPWHPDDPTYTSIEAPPSLKPAKKYSDLSGLPANYKDPLTQIRYSSAAEFTTLRTLPPDIVQGYLALRKANFLPS
ncbi:INO80 complex subunit C-like [Dysidea avara]|uniref:INO80 complex subunit C-like n=1 Tax=Dysidea avara TaxID=196820 RepID=UPI00331DFB07